MTTTPPLPPEDRSPASERSTDAPANWPVPPPPARPRASGARIADVTASILLVIAGVFVFGLLAFMSVFLVMASDGCYDDRCNTDLMSVGWLIAMLVPPAVFVAAIVWTLIRIARRKLAWWVPLAGAAVAGSAWGIGVAMIEASLNR
ncbi:DUF6264 family protein [Labedella endophytica]|uniref:Transmembrane protein n=1 Tax=Labedella endophytica TaxID=1523160 RepID=A0A3S0VRQ0_9MICO|nr:DUF6264 family protein [Labedella endophytica]RUQ98250.1 hypothetical protein ELQ94_14675 [Labedella endophytica]